MKELFCVTYVVPNADNFGIEYVIDCPDHKFIFHTPFNITGVNQCKAVDIMYVYVLLSSYG